MNSGVAGYLYVGSNATPTGVALVGNPVQLTLYDILGNKLGTTTTDGSGKYQFYNLAEGRYTVKINSATIPGGYGLDGDVDGAPIGEIIVDVDANQTAASTALKKHMWFIVVSEKGISGKVTYSPTQSTTASAGDALIGGITVELYDPANLTGTPLYTTTTKADGTYSFTNIPTTNYVIKVKAQDKTDGGYIDLTPTDGKIPVILPGAGVENQNFILGGTRSLSGKVGVDSDGDDAIDIDLANVHTKVTWYGSVEVSGNRVKVNIDSAIGTRATTPTLNAVEVNIGYRGSAAISGRLIYDNDDTDGNAYVSGVDAFLPAGHTVTLSGGSGFTARTTTTNASGEYAFTGLTTYADYKVTVTSPTGYMVSFDPDSAIVTPPAIPVGDGEAIIPIASSNEVKALQDFAFKGAGKIAGKIYIDLNDNGTFESAVDQPKGGIVVTLTHPTLPSRTATTDANGDYESTGIAVGEWTATITGGTSDLRSPSFDFDDPFASSGSPVTPLAAVVQVTASSLVADHVDFGFINRGKLEGAIKEDTYASGIYDASAPGIAGVTVYLVENDGVTPKTYADGTPIVLTTDESGLFTARNLDCPTSGSTYSVRVEFGPNTTGPLSMMEPSYDSDVSGAGYGSGVNLAAGTHVVNADLADPLAMRAPLDLHLGYRTSTGDIVIHKVAGKSTAKIGDIVPYTITIENMSDAPALNVTIEDLIPAGFKYVDGSSRLDGEKIEDPSGNRPLRFEKMDLGGASGAGTENAKRKLSYFLVVGSGVTQGEYTNSAIAKDQFNRNSSNVSQATVEITSDPLFDDSLIFGKVYIDSNGNGEQDAEEEGLGGIKLATGRSEIITTDEHGRYHIPAVDGGRWERGRNFILKLDVRSLPAGYKVISDNPIVVRTSPGLPSKINFRVKEIEVKDQETKTE